jgi:transcriptional regulator with XRE-family HTH domain
MMQKSLAAKLRLLRAQRGLTLKDASAQLGVDRHTLRRIELGTQQAQYPTLLKIARGYAIDVEDLLDLGDEPPAPKAEAPQLTAEQFADHNIPLTSDELAVLNELLKIYTEKAQTGAKRGNFLVPPGVDVDVGRLTMLFNYAVESGMLSPEDVEVLRTGIRARLKAGAT